MKLAVQSAFDRARDTLGKVGRDTGLGEIKTGDVGIYTRLALLVNILLGLMGIVAAIYIIHAGVVWIRAHGNEEDIKKAKEEIRGAIIGLMIIFSAYVVVNFVVDRLIKAIVQ